MTAVRVPTTVRITEPVEETIHQLMVQTGARRSVVLRAMLATARDHKDDVIKKLRAQL